MNSGDETMELFTCKFDIEVDGVREHHFQQAPRIFLERQFVSLVQQAYGQQVPIMIKMSREIPVWSQVDQKWLYRENSVVYQNHAYLKSHPM